MWRAVSKDLSQTVVGRLLLLRVSNTNEGSQRQYPANFPS